MDDGGGDPGFFSVVCVTDLCTFLLWAGEMDELPFSRVEKKSKKKGGGKVVDAALHLRLRAWLGALPAGVERPRTVVRIGRRFIDVTITPGGTPPVDPERGGTLAPSAKATRGSRRRAPSRANNTVNEMSLNELTTVIDDELAAAGEPTPPASVYKQQENPEPGTVVDELAGETNPPTSVQENHAPGTLVSPSPAGGGVSSFYFAFGVCILIAGLMAVADQDAFVCAAVAAMFVTTCNFINMLGTLCHRASDRVGDRANKNLAGDVINNAPDYPPRTNAEMRQVAVDPQLHMAISSAISAISASSRSTGDAAANDTRSSTVGVVFGGVRLDVEPQAPLSEVLSGLGFRGSVSMMGKPVSLARQWLSLNAFGVQGGAVLTCRVSPKMGLRGGMQAGEHQLWPTADEEEAKHAHGAAVVQVVDNPLAQDDGVEENKADPAPRPPAPDAGNEEYENSTLSLHKDTASQTTRWFAVAWAIVMLYMFYLNALLAMLWVALVVLAAGASCAMSWYSAERRASPLTSRQRIFAFFQPNRLLRLLVDVKSCREVMSSLGAQSQSCYVHPTGVAAEVLDREQRLGNALVDDKSGSTSSSLGFLNEGSTICDGDYGAEGDGEEKGGGEKSPRAALDDLSRGNPLFRVKKKLGSGAFGTVFRCERITPTGMRLVTTGRHGHRRSTFRRNSSFVEGAGDGDIENQNGAKEMEDVLEERKNDEADDEYYPAPREYAVKVLTNPTAKLLRELCKEALLMLKIKPHINISTLRFVLPFKGALLIFVDLVKSGKDLRKCVTDSSLYDGCSTQQQVISKLVDISLQLARALDHLHSRCHIIHFDVKLDNACLEQEAGGRVTLKLIDFGLSRVGVMKHMKIKSDSATGIQQPWVFETVTVPVWMLLFIGTFVIAIWTGATTSSDGFGWEILTVSFICRVLIITDTNRVPWPRRKPRGKPVLHAPISGGTPSYFSPEVKEAIAAKKENKKGSADILLCAAESDQWAWAIATAQMFKPKKEFEVRGADAGKQFRRLCADKRPSVDLTTKSAAAVVEWIENDVKLKGRAKFLTAITKQNITGVQLSMMLSATGEATAQVATELGLTEMVKSKSYFKRCIKGLRQYMLGGTEFAIPDRLQQLLKASFDQRRVERPADMNEVVKELETLEHESVVPCPHCGQRLFGNNGGAGHEEGEEDALDTAEKVGALVNTANALNEQGLIDECILAYAEALDVQRESGIDRLNDKKGGLRNRLLYMCFRRFWRLNLFLLFSLLIFPRGLVVHIYAVAGHSAGYSVSTSLFESLTPINLASLANAMETGGQLGPNSKFCNASESISSCGAGWRCDEWPWSYESLRIRQHTDFCQTCTSCVYGGMSQVLPMFAGSTVKPCRAIYTDPGGPCDDIDNYSTFIVRAGNALQMMGGNLSFLAALLFTTLPMIYGLFPAGFLSTPAMLRGLSFRGVNFQIVTVMFGILSPFVLKFQNWQKASRLEKRTGCEDWWYAFDDEDFTDGEQENDGPASRRPGIFARLMSLVKGEHLPPAQQKYWWGIIKLLRVASFFWAWVHYYVGRIFIQWVTWEFPRMVEVLSPREHPLSLLMLTIICLLFIRYNVLLHEILNSQYDTESFAWTDPKTWYDGFDFKGCGNYIGDDGINSVMTT